MNDPNKYKLTIAYIYHRSGLFFIKSQYHWIKTSFHIWPTKYFTNTQDFGKTGVHLSSQLKNHFQWRHPLKLTRDGYSINRYQMWLFSSTNQLGSTLTASLIATFNQSNVISSKWLSKSIKPWYVLRLINSDVTESDVSPPTSCLHVKNEREVNYYNNLQPKYWLLSPDFAQNPTPSYNIKITQLIGFVINWLVSYLWEH